MLNIDSLFVKLSSIQSGDICSPPNFNFSISSFVSDWLSVPTRDWGKSLEYLSKFTNNLISELRQSEQIDFPTFSKFHSEFPESIVYTEYEED